MSVVADQALHLPDLHRFTAGQVHYAVDAEAPNWVAVDERGRRVLDRLRDCPGIPLRALAAWYATAHGVEPGKAWVHTHDFVAALARAGMVFDAPVVRPPYPGRLALIEPDGLKELWIQINNACNLACTHCLVSSGPGEAAGPPLPWLRDMVDRAVDLGLERLYLTGGEPFVRRDLFELVAHATGVHGLEVIVLTNATVLRGRAARRLDELDRTLVRFQVSLDGARSATNDRIRGAGTFAGILDGARLLAGHGFELSLTTVTTRHNLEELPDLPGVARDVGAGSQHLMWAHRRGRAAAARNGFFPPTDRLVDAVLATARAADAAGVALDNVEVVKRRVNGMPGVKYDMGNGGWDSLCVLYDGSVYATAALAGDPGVRCGDATEQDLGEIFERSDVVRRLRESTIAQKPAVAGDPFRFFTGGGDWEHAWCFTGDPLGEDPYYPVQLALVHRVMTMLGEEKRARRNTRSGYDAPLVFHAMGEGAIACGTADGALAERPVLPLHSNCVLSFDVDRPRQKVREYYGAAAEVPNADLCCPARYDDAAIAHIPQDVLDRFYGCGSPVTQAGVRPGETVLDLGSGAGIDVFIAAKLVGPEGRAIGVDMTDEMLAVANANRPRVADALGYDVVEFRKGFLEQIPLPDASVDLVTSNCVINLSPDKPRVFEEMWRVLRDHGRFLISDIVSDTPVPPHLKVNPELWGECLVGALTQEEFLAQLERAGFYGIVLRSKTYWKDVEGYAFHSVTAEGRKFAKQAGCVFQGHRAVYLGPGKAFVDDEGHLFPRGELSEVCTDTAAKLSRPPYAAMFAIVAPDGERASYACCAADGACC